MEGITRCSFSEDPLQTVRDRACATLHNVGLGRFAEDLESDEAWEAFNAALAESHGPLSDGVRANRARTCLLLTDLIRSAANDGDLNDVIRHSMSLGALDEDLLSHAEQNAYVLPRQRQEGLKNAQAKRRTTRVENWKEWHQEAARFRRDQPDASEVKVAEHVATICEASAETVRKALRTLRDTRAEPTRKKS